MADVFVSYDRADRAIADLIADNLSRAGLSVWWDREIQAGVKFNAEIRRQIEAARAVIVLWSAASEDSDWVHDEASLARDADKLLPVRIDGTLPPLGFRQVQSLDLQGWNGDPSDRTFHALLSALRRLLGDAVAAQPPATTPRKTPGRATRKPVWLAAVAGAAVLGALVFVLLQSRQPLPAAKDLRVEVSAFKPIDQTDELTRFASGMTDTATRVFATKGIKVVTRTAAEHQTASPAELVLRGTVGHEGEQLVVNTEVVDARGGLVLWSTAMRGDVAHGRTLEQDFSGYLGWVLQCAANQQRSTKDDPSIDLFSRLLGVCDAFVSGRFEQAAEFARRIVAAAPQFAGGYALRATANASVTNADVGHVEKPPEEVARLRALVYEDSRIAEEMNPEVDSYYARAIVDDPNVGFAARERLFEKSIDVNPELAVGLRPLATLLERVGRIHDALDRLQRAVSINPMDVSSANEVARLNAWTGNLELARKQFDDLREQYADSGADFWQFWTELFLGDPAIAKRISERFVPTWSSFGKTTIMIEDACGRALLDWRVHDSHPSRTEIDAACPNGTGPDVPGFFGSVDDALYEWEVRGVPIVWQDTLFMPHFRSLRADPRFMRLALKMGLVDYWLETDRWPDFCREETLAYDCKTAALAARDNAKPAS